MNTSSLTAGSPRIRCQAITCAPHARQTARAPRPPCRSRAPRVEPSTGRAPHARRRARCAARTLGPHARVHDQDQYRLVTLRHAARLTPAVTESPSPPAVATSSRRDDVAAGVSAARGRRRERLGRTRPDRRRRAARLPLRREPRRWRQLSVGGATPSAGSAALSRSAMSSRLTRLQLRHLVDREPARLVARAVDLVAELPADHARAVDDAHRVERRRSRVALRRPAPPWCRCRAGGRRMPRTRSPRRSRAAPRRRGCSAPSMPPPGQGPSGAAVLVPVRQQDLPVADDHAVRGDADVHHDTVPAARGAICDARAVSRPTDPTAVRQQRDGQEPEVRVGRPRSVRRCSCSPDAAVSPTSLAGVCPTLRWSAPRRPAIWPGLSIDARPSRGPRSRRWPSWPDEDAALVDRVDREAQYPARAEVAPCI